jgi:protein-S-isoprenylcysteine O-methyltransferase Ste14
VLHGARRASASGQATQDLGRPNASLDAGANAAAATAERNASASGGTAILVVPTAGLFVMVGAVVAVNEVNHWWALVLAMLFALIATLLVVATVIRMLADND